MFKYEPIELSGLDKNKRSEKFSMALNLSEKAINSEEFELWFCSVVFTQLGNNSKLTNQELLNKLRRETHFSYSVVPRPWYKRFSSVVGWTSFCNRMIDKIGLKSIPFVYTYSDQFDGMSVQGLSGHLAHEVACHGNYFSHDFNWSKARDMSLPYRVGNWVEAYAGRNLI